MVQILQPGSSKLDFKVTKRIHFINPCVSDLILLKMKRRLYNLVVPEYIKEKLYRMHIEQYILEEQKQKIAVENSIPHIELSSIYFKNIKIIPNKSELLHLMLRYATVVEIGPDMGDFTYRILEITKPVKLYLLGEWSKSDQIQNLDYFKRTFDHQIRQNQVNIVCGAPIEEIKKIPDGTVDWIYINFGFTYNGTLKLLETCKEKVREGGIIAGNNYAIGHWMNGQRFGIIEAVHTFCKDNSWEMVYLTNESDRFLSYALKKMTSTI